MSVTPAPAPLWRRIAVTLLAPWLLLLAGYIPLPGTQVYETNLINQLALSGPRLSLAALGMAPILSAALLVELFAWLRPRWSALWTRPL